MKPPILEVRELGTKAFAHAPAYSLRVHAGERWLFCGDANAGKSALIKTLLGLISPARGDVLLDGVSLHTLAPQRMLAARRGISAVFSSTGLIPAWSGFDNLALPLRFQNKWSERQATRVVEDFAQTCGLPEHWLTQAAARLSKQESALLALARALIIQPRLLIVDNSLVMPLLAQGSALLGAQLASQLAGGCALVLSVHTLGGAERSLFADAAAWHTLFLQQGSVQFAPPAAPNKDPA